jgi:hypothetical protein
MQDPPNPFQQFLAQQFLPPRPQPETPPDNPFARFLASALTVPSKVLGGVKAFGEPTRNALANLQKIGRAHV